MSQRAFLLGGFFKPIQQAWRGQCADGLGDLGLELGILPTSKLMKTEALSPVSSDKEVWAVFQKLGSTGDKKKTMHASKATTL